MNMRRGMRRAMVFLTILYWVVVTKVAITRAMVGGWGYGEDPLAFLGGAALVYGVCFGVGWTLYGFTGAPRGRW